MKSEKALKAGVGYTIGNYLIKGMNFLTIPIFARLLSTEDYGIYNLFVAYEGFLSIFIGLAIHSSYKNARYKYKDSVNADKGFSFDSYVSATFVLVIFNTLIWLIGVNVFGRQLTSMLMLDGWCINLLVIYSASNAIILCFNSKTSLTYEYKSFLTVAFINAIMNLTLSIMLVTLFFKRSKYVGRIIGTVIPITVLAFFIVKKYLKKQKICYIKDYLRWGIGYSLPIVPHGISQIILSQFDRIMINSMVGLAQAGIYSFAYNIFSIISVTFTSLDNVWGQWFYDKMNSGDKKKIRKVSSLYMILMLLFSIMVILASPELIVFLGSKKYQNAIYCVIPIVAAGYFSYLYTLPCQIEYFYEKTKFIAIGTVTAAFINIILNYICIKSFGYIAAAYTTLFTYFLYFLFHYFLALHIQGEKIFSHRIISGCIITMFISVVGALFTIKYPLIRWSGFVFCGIIAIMLEEKYIRLLKRIKIRLKGC